MHLRLPRHWCAGVAAARLSRAGDAGVATSPRVDYNTYMPATSAADFRPDWSLCQGSDCIGIRAEPFSRCLAHLNDEELTTILYGLEPGSDIDVRGVSFTDSLLRRFLYRLRDEERIARLGYSRFQHTRFQAKATFSGAQFHGQANFDNAKFHEGASFGGAEFEEEANFPFAEFHGSAEFRGARFNDFAGLESPSFTAMPPSWVQSSNARVGSTAPGSRVRRGSTRPFLVIMHGSSKLDSVAEVDGSSMPSSLARRGSTVLSFSQTPGSTAPSLE
jgi:hypothetical protein